VVPGFTQLMFKEEYFGNWTSAHPQIKLHRVTSWVESD